MLLNFGIWAYIDLSSSTIVAHCNSRANHKTLIVLFIHFIMLLSFSRYFTLSYFSTILDFHFLHFLSLQIQYPIHTIPLILQFTAVLHNDMVMLHTNCFYSSYSFIFAFLLWLFAGHYRSALFLPPTMGTRIPWVCQL